MADDNNNNSFGIATEVTKSTKMVCNGAYATFVTSKKLVVNDVFALNCLSLTRDYYTYLINKKYSCVVS